MQVIYPVNGGDASNILLTAQKRLVRPVYAQTQGTPYACYLDPSLRNAEGTIRVPQASDTEPLTRSHEAFTYQGSIVPGTVLVKTTGENVCVANGANAAVQPFGLLGQWLGGTFDNVHNTNEIASWRGPDSVYDIVAPGFNEEGVAEAVASASAGTRVYMYAGTDGRLTTNSPGGSAIPVCWIVERQSAAVLRINVII